MTAPNKARIQASDLLQQAAAYETQAGDLLQAINYAGQRGNDYGAAVELLTPELVGPMIAIADKLDSAFADSVPGAPLEGAVSTSARALVELGRLPMMNMGAPAWLPEGSPVRGIWEVIKMEAQPLRVSAMKQMRGIAAQDAKALERNTALWNAAHSSVKAVSNLGTGALYDYLKPKFDQLEAGVHANPGNTKAMQYYSLCKPVMDAAASLRGQGLLGLGLGAIPLSIGAIGAALGSCSVWVYLGIGALAGVGIGITGKVIYDATNRVGGIGGLFTLLLVAGGGYYAYKKGYLARIGLKPKGV
jgi:hypothetical protein